MRFLLDENFPRSAIALLEQGGHMVFDFRGTSEEGIEDLAVFEKACVLDAVLLTTDRDFFHTIPHLFNSHPGVVVVALRQPNRDAILSRLKWFLGQVSETSFRNRSFQLRDGTWLCFPPLA